MSSFPAHEDLGGRGSTNNSPAFLFFFSFFFFSFFFLVEITRAHQCHSLHQDQSTIWLSELRRLWMSVPWRVACELVSLIGFHTMRGQFAFFFLFFLLKVCTDRLGKKNFSQKMCKCQLHNRSASDTRLFKIPSFRMRTNGERSFFHIYPQLPETTSLGLGDTHHLPLDSSLGWKHTCSVSKRKSFVLFCVLHKTVAACSSVS